MKIQIPTAHACATESVRVAKGELQAFARAHDAGRPSFQATLVRVGLAAAASALAASLIGRLLPIRHRLAPAGATPATRAPAGRRSWRAAFWPVAVRCVQFAAPLAVAAVSRAGRAGQGASRA